MNNPFNLKINTPCTKNFNDFSSTNTGGFCNTCTKEVVDFTKMNSQEITNYFQITHNKSTCGRFRKDQLKTYTSTTQKKRKNSVISGIGFVLIALFSFSKVQAQDKKSIKSNDQNPSKFQTIHNEKNITVKGNVTENGTPLPDANVTLNGTTIGTATDFDGYFEFPEKLKKGDILVFSYLGMNAKKIVIQNKNSALIVTLNVNLKMDTAVLMGEVAVKEVYKSK